MAESVTVPSTLPVIAPPPPPRRLRRAQRAALEFKQHTDCLMHLETRKDDALRFRAMVEVLYRVMGEGTLTFDATGMSGNMVSKTIEQIMFKFPAKSNLYFFRAKEPISIDVDFKAIYHQLRIASQHHRIILQLHRSHTDKLKVMLLGGQQSASTFAWDFNVLCLPDKEERLPQTLHAVFDIRVCMQIRDFRQILAAAGQDAEIQFLSSMDALYTNAASRGQTTGVNAQRSRLPLCNLKDVEPPRIDEARPLTIDCIQSYGRPSDKRDAFLAKYLYPFAQVNGIADTLEMFLGNGMPLTLRLAIGRMGHLVYIVAPMHDDAVSMQPLLSLSQAERLSLPQMPVDEEEEEEEEEATQEGNEASQPLPLPAAEAVDVLPATVLNETGVNKRRKCA